MRLPIICKILFCVCITFLISTSSGKTARLVDGAGDDEGYLQVQINKQWISVCDGNSGLVEAACKWNGYTSGKENRRKSTQQFSGNSWSFNVTCPVDVPDLSTCSVGRCTEKRRMYVKCSGYPHCTMSDGTIIPGNNSSLFVGNNKVCRCNTNNELECDCRNIAMKCKDGTTAMVDNQCRPMCSVDKACADTQVSSLCGYYKKIGQCSNKTIQSICRNTCDLCDASPTPTFSSECKDQYDTEICKSWRDLGGCARENVREVCAETCGGCDGLEEEGDNKTDDEKEPTKEAATEKKSSKKQIEEVSSTKKVKEETCTDEYDLASCQIWRDNGYCSKNSSVKNWCKATCGVCEETCTDSLGELFCAAALRYGSCSKNLKVLRGCANTCGLCEPISDTNCTDLYRTKTCTMWSRQGRCDTDSDIPKFCAKSCGVCKTVQTQLPTLLPDVKKESCEDTSDQSLCSYYKSAGYCGNRQYLSAMRSQCKDTCGLCGLECKDMELESTCKVWKDGGHCESNRSLREKVCPFTCGTC